MHGRLPLTQVYSSKRCTLHRICAELNVSHCFCQTNLGQWKPTGKAAALAQVACKTKSIHFKSLREKESHFDNTCVLWVYRCHLYTVKQTSKASLQLYNSSNSKQLITVSCLPSLCPYLQHADDLHLVEEDEGGERGQEVLLEDGRCGQDNVLDVLHPVCLVNLLPQL